MPEPVLELDRVEVRYGSVAAVRGVRLHVDEGEIVGLIGPNGAGKSTTLHAIMGVVPPSAGEIRLRGRSLRRKSSESIAHAGVALVPEGRRIFSGFTVEENLRLGLAARRRNGGGDPLEVAYDLFPVLREFRRRNAGHLSGGQQQQLAIARALVAGPDVLLLDEPSLGLAPKFVTLIFEKLVAMKASGYTLMLVEQNAARALAIADRGYVLELGRNRFEGAGPQLLTDPDVKRLYLGG